VLYPILHNNNNNNNNNNRPSSIGYDMWTVTREPTRKYKPEPRSVFR